MWGLLGRISYYGHFELNTSCFGGGEGKGLAYPVLWMFSSPPGLYTLARITLLHVMTTEKHVRLCQTKNHPTEERGLGDSEASDVLIENKEMGRKAVQSHIIALLIRIEISL